jgi:DHA1 family tetracycline resistance protein-like MFS transporter
MYISKPSPTGFAQAASLKVHIKLEFQAVANVSPSRKTLSVLLSVVFLDNLGYAIIFPYVFFYASSLGASAFAYGLLLSSYSLMSFIFTPIIARLSDRYGRRSMLLPALLTSGLSYVVFGLSNVLWLLFLARIIAGTTAATIPVAQAYVADVTTAKDRLKYLAWTGAAGGSAFIVGQTIGGVLSGFFGYAVPSFLAAALAFWNLISAYFWLSEPAHSVSDTEKSAFTLSALRVVLRKRTISLLLTVYFMFFLAFVFLQVVIPPWLETLFGFGSLQTGFLFAYMGVLSVVTQTVLLPWLSGKIKNMTLAMVGIILLGVGLLALGTLPFLALLVLIGALVAFGFGILLTTLITLISVNTTVEAQGGTLGIAQSFAALAQTIGPTVAAFLFAFGTSIGLVGLAFIISAGLTLVTIPLLINIKAQKTGQPLR